MTDNTPTIARTAMLASLHISQWSGRKYDKAASEELTQSKHAKEDSARVNKLLVDKSSLHPLQKTANAVRTEFYRVTLPWGDDGARILPAEKYTDFMEYFQRMRDEFNGLVEEFVTRYRDEVRRAATELGDLFDIEDYPQPSDVRRKFQMAMTVRPIPTADDFRVDLSSEVEAAIKEQVAEDLDRLTREATNHLWQQMGKQLLEIRDRLADPDARFRRALLDNFMEMVGELDKLNVSKDPQLTKLRQEVESNLLALRDPETLREDKQARKQAADDASQVIDQFADLWG